MFNCVICGVVISQTVSEREGRSYIITVLRNIYNKPVPDCSCLQKVICIMCHATFRRLIQQKKRARQSWKALSVQFQLPSALLHEVAGCSQCHETNADAARRGHSEIDTGTSGEQNDCETVDQPDMEVELHASEKEQQVKSSQEEPSMPEKVLFL